MLRLRPVGARYPFSGSDPDRILSGLFSLGELGTSPFQCRLVTRPAESSLFAYGLIVHLPWLPAMPRGVTSHCSEIAVTFGYKLR